MSTEQFGSYISLATFKRDGSEVRTPVWYATSGGKMYVFTDEATEKRAYAALQAKYGWQMKIVDLLSTLAGRIGARSILELELDDPNSRG